MTNAAILIPILISAICTFILRALPFWAFSGTRKMPVWLERLGQVLPAAIMAVLIVYCLKDAGEDWMHIGLPKFLAVAVVAVSYKWKHNILVSIVLGTACYMTLLQVMVWVSELSI